MLKRKNTPDLNDWKRTMTKFGIPADMISRVSGRPVPDKLYYELAQDAERTAIAAQDIPYNTTHSPLPKKSS